MHVYPFPRCTDRLYRNFKGGNLPNILQSIRFPSGPGSPGHPYLSELTIIGCKSPLHCNPTVPPWFNCFIRAFGPRFAILGLYYRSTGLQIVSISPPFSGQIERGSIDPHRRLEHRHAGPSPPMVTNRYCGGVFPRRRPSRIARSDGGICAHQRSCTC